MEEEYFLPEEEFVECLIFLRDLAIDGKVGTDDDDRRKAIGLINEFLAKHGIPPKEDAA